MAVVASSLKKEILEDKTIVTDYIHPHSLNNGIPTAQISNPKLGGDFSVDDAVLKALPIPGTRLTKAYRYGSSLWGLTAKLVTQLPDGSAKSYFLKCLHHVWIIPNDDPGRHMCEGEFESLKAMHGVVPSFIPEVYGWGHVEKGPGYFLLAEFREVGQQPPDPPKLTMRLAELHKNSVSPTGKFGFHVTTCHGNIPQYVGWEESWTVMFTKVLSRAMDIDENKHGHWPEFSAYRKLLFTYVIPRLLEPLESNGRSVKPCLIHGDIWDENCADDMNTGEPFALDAGSLYAHNEYEIGYWRPPRHRLSNKTYVRAYKKHFPVSEPEEDWDDRNLLYSMRFNISCSVLIPSSGQRPVVFEDMKTLCKKHCPEQVKEVEAQFKSSMANVSGGHATDDEEEEEEEEEE